MRLHNKAYRDVLKELLKLGPPWCWPLLLTAQCVI